MASLQEMTGVLGHWNANHLLKRACYRFSKTRVDELANMTASAAVDSFFLPNTLSLEEPIDYNTGQPWINTGIEPAASDNNLRYYIAGWWLNEALNDDTIHHKMTFFLHSNLVINITADTPRSGFDYIKLLSFYATGSYKSLAKKMVRNRAMLYYLDGRNNTRTNPNENFAREFLELFTIGKGPQIGADDYTHYTEHDIVELSKLLTGWRTPSRPLGGNPEYTDPETGLTQGYASFSLHDPTNKVFSHAFQEQTVVGATDEDDMDRELQDFVDIVFSQDETARNICRKLYRFFVGRNITSEIENDIIEPLANTLRSNNYNLEVTLKRLLKSQHFYDLDDNTQGDHIIGGMIKSPLEMVLQTMTFFGLEVVDPQINPFQHYNEFFKESVLEIMLGLSGLNLFRPELVAGYPAYYQAPYYHRNWLSASTIIVRYKLGQMLLTGRRVVASTSVLGSDIRLDIVKFVRDDGSVSNPLLPGNIVDDLSRYLLTKPLSEKRREYFLNEVLLDGLSENHWYFEWLAYLNTGNEENIRGPLERLAESLIFSQEYQLM